MISYTSAFNSKFATADKRCLIVDGELKCFAEKDLIEYTIPQNVNTIDQAAFHNCKSLVNITIPENVALVKHIIY